MEIFCFLAISGSVYTFSAVIVFIKIKRKEKRTEERKGETLHDRNIKLQGWFISILKSFFTTAGSLCHILIREVKQFLRLRVCTVKPENGREGGEGQPCLRPMAAT